MNIRSDTIRILGLLLAAVMLFSTVAGCAGGADPSPDASSPEETEASSEGPELWAANMNVRETGSVSQRMDISSFDERFLAYLSAHTEGNYMASPLSFRYALGLLLAGAEGETKAELLRALGISSEEEWISCCLDFNGFVEYFASGLEQDIAIYKEDLKNGWISEDAPEPFRALRVANSVWKAERIEKDLKEAYRESIEKNYAAEFRSFTEQNAVRKINEWADAKTEHMIPHLLPDDYHTEYLAVVLMNALYFKDSWRISFPEHMTKEADFHTKDSKTVTKDFMSVTDTFSYYSDEDTSLVILPMDGGISMAFVLGSTEGLADKISKASAENVIVTIPKMDLETGFSGGEFVDFLKDSGALLAFDQHKADFSSMIDHRIYVSDIIQKTRIKLDEDGVEAAAATAVMMEEEAAMEPVSPKVFTADSPFSFYIYTTCNDTTSILFAGRMVE